MKCYFCDESHRLESCESFKKTDGEQQFRFIRQKKLCDNCLSSFHFSAPCKRRKACTFLDCDIRRKNLGSIHNALKEFEERRNRQYQTGRPRQEPNQIDNSVQAVPRRPNQFSGLRRKTGVCGMDEGLPIVPVRVKCLKRNEVISTYALLDSGSMASFCSNVLLAELGIKGRPCQIQLATIGGVSDEYRASLVSLEIMNLDETVCIQMNTVYATKNLNIPTTAITRQDDVNQSSYR